MSLGVATNTMFSGQEGLILTPRAPMEAAAKEKPNSFPEAELQPDLTLLLDEA